MKKPFAPVSPSDRLDHAQRVSCWFLAIAAACALLRYCCGRL